MLLLIDEMVTAQCQQLKIERADFRFSRRQVRQATGWSATQVRIHMDRLQEMEYLLAHRGGSIGQSFVYELLLEHRENPVNPQAPRPQIPGLINVYDLNLTDSEGQLAGSKRDQNGGVTEGWRSDETRMNGFINGVLHGNPPSSTVTGAQGGDIVAEGGR